MAGYQSGATKRRARAVRAAAVLAIAIGVVALFIADAAAPSGGVISDLRSGVSDLGALAARATSAPGRWLSAWSKQIAARSAAVKDNIALRAEVEDLRQWRDLALTQQERLSSYERLIGIAPDAAPPPIAAQVVGDRDSPFRQSRLLNVGKAHGVKNGDVVVGPDGVIGRIVGVGERSARVLLLTDANSQVPVMTAQGARGRSLLAGGNARPALRNLAPEAVLVEGERVVTSGEGRLFPRGLTVGTLTRDGGVWRVNLAADIDALSYVRLLSFSPPHLQEEIDLTPPPLPETPPEPLPDTAPPPASFTAARGSLDAAARPQGAAPSAVATTRPRQSPLVPTEPAALVATQAGAPDNAARAIPAPLVATPTEIAQSAAQPPESPTNPRADAAAEARPLPDGPP